MSALPVLNNLIAPAPHEKPSWLRVKAPSREGAQRLKKLIDHQRLNTVCESAACPNMGECWQAGTATFMILGNLCTRACRFCDVKTSNRPGAVDLDEPKRLGEASAMMNLRHVVLTSVTRDDLPDGGAMHFVRCMKSIRDACDDVTLEVLTPDFRGDFDDLQTVLDAEPEIFNHNIETVQRLTPRIRSGAVYHRSLDLLIEAKNRAPHLKTKSGLMLGLGETDEEVIQTIHDLNDAKVDILTIGQYLRPSPKHHQVMRYVSPDNFDLLGEKARALGFSHVESGPLVRSSYHAERAL
jgi:lipoic acid synthetase